MLQASLPECSQEAYRGFTGSHTTLINTLSFSQFLQSGRCSRAKHGDAYFSAICGSIQDPIAAPGLYENQEC